jgi:hypothetical protein
VKHCVGPPTGHRKVHGGGGGGLSPVELIEHRAKIVRQHGVPAFEMEGADVWEQQLSVYHCQGSL